MIVFFFLKKNLNTVVMQCLQFCNISSCKKKMSKIKFNLLFEFWASVNLIVVKNDICYCEKIVSEFVSFQSFLCCCCNKVIFVLMFDTQYYFYSMFCTENWIVVRVELTNAILWRCNFAIDCVVKMLLWECTWCFCTY